MNHEMAASAPLLSEQLQDVLRGIDIQALEHVFVKLYLKNAAVLRSKDFLIKQSTAEVLRQISVMTTLASVQYPFSEATLNALSEVPDLHHAFCSPAGRLRIRDLFTEWVMTTCPEKKWPTKSMNAQNHTRHNISIWDSNIPLAFPALHKALLLTCIMASYFEFSLTTLREFGVSKTAYKRSKSLRERHLEIASQLKDVCLNWPLAEISAIMHAPLDRAILVQQSPDLPLLVPAI